MDVTHIPGRVHIASKAQTNAITAIVARTLQVPEETVRVDQGGEGDAGTLSFSAPWGLDIAQSLLVDANNITPSIVDQINRIVGTRYTTAALIINGIHRSTEGRVT